MFLDRIREMLEQHNPVDIKKYFPRVKEILYYGLDGNLDFKYERIDSDTFEVVESLFSVEDDFEEMLDNDEMLNTVLQSLEDDYSAILKDDKLTLKERESIKEKFEEDKFCYNCRYYDKNESLCKNTEAFSINRDYPTLRNFDSKTVIIKGLDEDNITIPYNFGCIHYKEKD